MATALNLSGLAPHQRLFFFFFFFFVPDDGNGIFVSCIFAAMASDARGGRSVGVLGREDLVQGMPITAFLHSTSGRIAAHTGVK